MCDPSSSGQLSFCPQDRLSRGMDFGSQPVKWAGRHSAAGFSTRKLHGDFWNVTKRICVFFLRENRRMFRNFKQFCKMSLGIDYFSISAGFCEHFKRLMAWKKRGSGGGNTYFPPVSIRWIHLAQMNLGLNPSDSQQGSCCDHGLQWLTFCFSGKSPNLSHELGNPAESPSKCPPNLPTWLNIKCQHPQYSYARMSTDARMFISQSHPPNILYTPMFGTPIHDRSHSFFQDFILRYFDRIFQTTIVIHTYIYILKYIVINLQPFSPHSRMFSQQFIAVSPALHSSPDRGDPHGLAKRCHGVHSTGQQGVKNCGFGPWLMVINDG